LSLLTEPIGFGGGVVLDATVSMLSGTGLLFALSEAQLSSGNSKTLHSRGLYYSQARDKTWRIFDVLGRPA
jgi:hypothetical protein